MSDEWNLLKNTQTGDLYLYVKIKIIGVDSSDLNNYRQSFCSFLIPAKYTYHSCIRIFGTIAKSGSQSARTTFVVMGVLTIVNGTVDTDGPHTCGVSVTITVVLFSAISRCPDIDIAQPVSALMGTRKRATWTNGNNAIFSLFFSVEKKLKIKRHYFKTFPRK